MILIFLLISVSYILILSIKKLVRRWKTLNKLSTIPGPERRSFLLGNLDMFQENGKPLNYTIGQRLMGLSKLYEKDGMFKFFIGTKPIVCVFSPEGFRAILGSNNQIEKPDAVRTLKHCLGNGLGTAEGETWKRNRKLLMPTFSTKVLNGYLPAFNRHSFLLCDLICKEKLISDVEHLTVNTTLNLICETAMGIEYGHGSGQKVVTKESNCRNVTQEMYTKSLQVFTEILVKRIFSPWLQFDFIFFMTRLGREFNYHVNRIHLFTKRIIRDKSARIENNNSSKQVAFLDLLLQLKRKGVMSEEDIRAEVDTFTFAGHDTTAVTLTFALFEIGNNSDVQKKMYQEILNIFGSDHLRDVTCEDLNRLKYTECVIKEVLRLYPPGPTVGRVLTSPVQLKERTIPTGTEVWCLIAALHMNPNMYHDPVHFKPERFMNQLFDTFSFAPFSSGTRNCIGHRFAMMALKVTVANVIRRFKLTSLCSRDKLLLNFELILRTKSEIRIKFDSRLL